MLLQLGSKCFCLFYFLKNITLNFVTADEFLEISIYMHICIMYIYICIYIKNNKQQYIYINIYIYIYIYIHILMYYVPKCPLKCVWLFLELCCKIYDVCQTILGCYALKSWHPVLSPPICSKIFEKFIVDRIFNFMEQNSLWWTFQIYTTTVIEIFTELLKSAGFNSS